MYFEKKIYFIIKYSLKRFIIYLSLPVVFLGVLKILFLIFFNKNKLFFIQEEGGFGHTITSPIYLDSILKDKWILIFCYSNARHNKAINHVFNNKIFFLNCSPFYLELDLRYRQVICNVLKKLSNLFFNVNIESIMEKLFKVSYTSENKNEYSKRYESRIWPFILNNKTKYILNDNFKKKFNLLSQNNNKKYKGKICFFVRNRMPQIKNANLNNFEDISSILRESRNIEDYRLAITELIKENWQVYISGDFIEEPEWFHDFSNDIIFSSKNDLPIKLYNFLVGFYSDVVIGPASGGLLYNLFNFKKSLLLETYEIGCGYPYSLVSYPNISFNSRKEFNDIMVNKSFTWDKNFYLQRVKPLNSKQIAEICVEFINNSHLDNYGVNPYDLGIKEGALIQTKSRFSKKWLEIIGFKKLN